MSIDERVHAVIRALYDAAMDETLWPEALNRVDRSHRQPSRNLLDTG
jgi:hypothetical protein